MNTLRFAAFCASTPPISCDMWPIRSLHRRCVFQKPKNTWHCKQSTSWFAWGNYWQTSMRGYVGIPYKAYRDRSIAAMVTGRERIGLVVQRMISLKLPKATWMKDICFTCFHVSCTTLRTKPMAFSQFDPRSNHYIILLIRSRPHSYCPRPLSTWHCSLLSRTICLAFRRTRRGLENDKINTCNPIYIVNIYMCYLSKKKLLWWLYYIYISTICT